jgi:hypothetical protein
MWVELGIGGLKQKWKRFMKCFESKKENNIHLFLAIVILTNVLFKYHLNFTYEVIGNQINDPIDYIWDVNFKIQVKYIPKFYCKICICQNPKDSSYFQVDKLKLFFLFYVNFHLCFD